MKPLFSYYFYNNKGKLTQVYNKENIPQQRVYVTQMLADLDPFTGYYLIFTDNIDIDNIGSFTIRDGDPDSAKTYRDIKLFVEALLRTEFNRYKKEVKDEFNAVRLL